RSNPPYFIVSVTDEKNELRVPVYRYLGIGSKNEGHSCFLHSFVVPTLRRSRKLNVFGADSTNNDSLTLCEIYVYSECLFPNYGPTCEDICSIGCLGLSCHATGECFKCLPGMRGKLCLQSELGQVEAQNESESFEDLEKPADRTREKSSHLFAGMDLVWAAAFGGIVFVSSTMCLLFISCHVLFSNEKIAKKSRSLASYLSSKTSSVRQRSAVSSHMSSVNEMYQIPSKMTSLVSNDSQDTDV
ncbi:hypothetical protein Btru_032673, partial [Bulinus truncatus]